MPKLLKAYVPFILYSLCVAFAYFITFYVFPNYYEPLAYLGFFLIYFYLYFCVIFIGFFIGKLTMRRFNSLNFKVSFAYAILSFFIMLIIASCKYIFTYLYNDFSISLTGLWDTIYDIDTKILAVGTFLSFFTGELVEQHSLRRKINKDLGK